MGAVVTPFCLGAWQPAVVSGLRGLVSGLSGQRRVRGEERSRPVWDPGRVPAAALQSQPAASSLRSRPRSPRAGLRPHFPFPPVSTSLLPGGRLLLVEPRAPPKRTTPSERGSAEPRHLPFSHPQAARCPHRQPPDPGGPGSSRAVSMVTLKTRLPEAPAVTFLLRPLAQEAQDPPPNPSVPSPGAGLRPQGGIRTRPLGAGEGERAGPPGSDCFLASAASPVRREGGVPGKRLRLNVLWGSARGPRGLRPRARPLCAGPSSTGQGGGRPLLWGHGYA